MVKDYSKLEKKLGIKFKNQDLLIQSLIHRSYLNENPDFYLGQNERLEFLGDAVLELIVTEYIYKSHPKAAEGEMTNWRAALVNANMLSEVSSKLKIEEHLFLSRGEAKDSSSKARQYILANAFEALIGAIYLDQGIKVTSKFIEKNLLTRLSHIIEDKLFIDPKTRFQEVSQEFLSITPTYRVLSERGPDHAKHFLVAVCLNDEVIASGEGSSKQEAQLQAAERALEVKGWK